jgi:hypothetical protein
MDDLICRKATGKAEEFAAKLGISRSQLLQDVKELREMGAPIEYCPINQSYVYSKPCLLNIDLGRLKGGTNIFNGYCQSRYNLDSLLVTSHEIE